MSPLDTTTTHGLIDGAGGYITVAFPVSYIGDELAQICDLMMLILG